MALVATRFAPSSVAGQDTTTPGLATPAAAWSFTDDAGRTVTLPVRPQRGDAKYVANPGDWADLAMYERLGLNIIHPDVDPGEFWQTLSVEQAMLYPSDILFQSTREEVLTLEAMATHPTYSQLPAVKAKQLGDWNQDVIQSYQGLAAALDSMTAVLANARDVTP